MALKVEIDKRSGFCGGVIRAIGRAEEFLGGNPSGRLYSLGAIVHNEAELKRLDTFSSSGFTPSIKPAIRLSPMSCARTFPRRRTPKP